jgi:hypothetical protein
MAHAAKYGRVTRQMDGKTAFIQSAVSELIYVKQPQVSYSLMMLVMN